MHDNAIISKLTTGKICPIFISHGFHRRSAHYTIQAAGENGEDRLLLQLGAAVAAVPNVKNVKSQRHMAPKKSLLEINWLGIHSMIMIKDYGKIRLN